MNYKPVMTGISRLDKILGGLRPGTLNVISGRPGMGKTSLALSIAIKAAKNRDKAVLYYSLEAARTEIVRKLLVSELLYDHESGNCESIKTILNGFENLPIYVDDCLNLTPDLLYEKYDALLADNVDARILVNVWLTLEIFLPILDGKNNKGTSYKLRSLCLTQVLFNTLILIS